MANCGSTGGDGSGTRDRTERQRQQEVCQSLGRKKLLYPEPAGKQQLSMKTGISVRSLDAPRTTT